MQEISEELEKQIKKRMKDRIIKGLREKVHYCAIMQLKMYLRDNEEEMTEEKFRETTFKIYDAAETFALQKIMIENKSFESDRKFNSKIDEYAIEYIKQLK